MATDKPNLPKPGDAASVRPPALKSDAFDLWLQRGLHELFDDIANEPVPDALLKMIEDGRPK